jgi:hypothetical protein
MSHDQMPQGHQAGRVVLIVALAAVSLAAVGLSVGGGSVAGVRGALGALWTGLQALGRLVTWG